MANEHNLKKGKATQFHSGEEAVRNGRKGGKASGKKKREQKAIRQILTEMLDITAKDSKQFAGLAKKLGLESDKSVKEAFTMVCLLNTLKKGDLSDLEKLTLLLGEDRLQSEDSSAQSDLLEAIKKAVKDD